MTKNRDEIEKDIQHLMEGEVHATVGEDGLTVFDFADLRDAFIDYHLKSKDDICPKCKRKMTEAVRWYICPDCWHKVKKLEE